MSVTFESLAQPHANLCLFKVQKSDASIRPLFPNPVTYIDCHFVDHHIQDEYFQPFDLPDGVMLDSDPHCDHVTRKSVICFGVEGNYMNLAIAIHT